MCTSAALCAPSANVAGSFSSTSCKMRSTATICLPAASIMGSNQHTRGYMCKLMARCCTQCTCSVIGCMIVAVQHVACCVINCKQSISPCGPAVGCDASQAYCCTPELTSIAREAAMYKFQKHTAKLLDDR